MIDAEAFRHISFQAEVEWWEIERRSTPGGRTTYGIRIGKERLAHDEQSVFEAINAALAVLDQRETADAQTSQTAESC
jgi:hypothetical protein